MTEPVSLEGVDPAALLAALYNNSRPMGMGILHASAAEMTTDEAQALIDRGHGSFSDVWSDPRKSGGHRIDYCHGRPLKVTIPIDGDPGEIDPWGYDRDNGGPGTLARIVASLRTTADRS